MSIDGEVALLGSGGCCSRTCERRCGCWRTRPLKGTVLFGGSEGWLFVVGDGGGLGLLGVVPAAVGVEEVLGPGGGDAEVPPEVWRHQL